MVAAGATPWIVLALSDVLGATEGQFAFGLSIAAGASALSIRNRWPEQVAVHSCLAAIVAIATVRAWDRKNEP